jgi:uncharacterized protein (DUF1697 family)
MTTYISILRGINVNGQNLIKMDALRALYSSLGLEQVQSYIQSGNVLFQCAGATPQQLSERISAAIRLQWNMEVPVLVFSREYLHQAVAENPFVGNADPVHLHLTFLAQMPDEELLSSLDAQAYAPDRFIVLGQIVYLHCPNGYGKTKLSNQFWERKLRVQATTRNWKSCQELLRLSTEIP